MSYNVELVACNRRVLTDGHTSLDCKAVFKIVGILKELAAYSGDASLSDGLLILDDGTSYDLEKLFKEATKGS